MITTRFAPSPTGHLHLGHAYSALFAEKASRLAKGRFLLRIEDIDPVRCKASYTDDLIEDLRALGLRWDGEVRKQSEHMDDYQQALDVLRAKELIYPCFCTRSEVAAEAEAMGHAPHHSGVGPDGPVYAGTCCKLSVDQVQELMTQKPYVWRLNVAKALEMTGPLSFVDRAEGRVEARPEIFGDVVLARKDVPTSYHLSVTVDDHLQGISLVTRGKDLLQATFIHRLLQALLGYRTPDYYHHDLLLDSEGKRFAKRNKAATLRSLYADGKTPNDIRVMCGFIT